MNYRVTPFNIEEDSGNNFYYIITADTSCRTQNIELISILTHLLNNCQKETSYTELEKLATSKKIDINELLQFLIYDLHLLVPDEINKFSALNIYSDDEHILKLISDEFSHGYGFANVATNPPLSTISDGSLNVLFMNSYNESLVNSLYSEINQHKAYLITSYLLHKYYIIDNIYISNKALPCHYCYINRFSTLSNNDFASAQHNESAWLNLFKEIMQTNKHIKPKLHISPIQLNLVGFHLYNSIKCYIPNCSDLKFVDELLQNTKIDLTSGTIHKEFVSKWPGCQCKSFMVNDN